MRTTITVTLAGVLLCTAVPVFAQSVGERSGVNSVLGISPTTQDFITQAAVSDLFEIESARLALERAPDAATKAYAQHMMTDHTKTSEELKALAASANLKIIIPTALDESHRAQIERLKGLSGKDFSDAYRKMQVSAHENAVSLFQRYAEGGEVPALKAWAGTTLPLLQHHLKMAEDLKT